MFRVLVRMRYFNGPKIATIPSTCLAEVTLREADKLAACGCPKLCCSSQVKQRPDFAVVLPCMESHSECMTVGGEICTVAQPTDRHCWVAACVLRFAATNLRAADQARGLLDRSLQHDPAE